MAALKIPVCPRLLCCASLVRPGARVADIGCDHGYLAIHLLRTGRAAFVHACDLREKPLQRARENCARFGVTQGIRFSQADGLAAIDPAQVDTIVCAGMGGDLIVQLLAAAPWLKCPDYRLILQPQSAGQELRRALSEQGFSITRERLVEDGGFLYYVMELRFGGGVPLTPGQQYCSPALLRSGDPLLPAYLARLENSLRRTLDSLAQAKGADVSEKQIWFETALRELCAMKEEILCQP